MAIMAATVTAAAATTTVAATPATAAAAATASPQPRNLSTLPAEIWQHIFTFLPPIALGKLMRVNRSFKALLNPYASSFPIDDTITPGESPAPGILRPISPSTIWSVSRKAFHAGAPRPLSYYNEFEMCKLLYRTDCQFCGKKSAKNASGEACTITTTTNNNNNNNPSSSSLLQGDPGPDGVRIIWPFGVRVCANCLLKHSEKEMDLLFSSLPSFLVAGLAPAFFTPSLHYVPSTSLRVIISSPSSQPVELTKRFFKPHIEELRRKFENVKALGPAAAEEWVKGLESTGKEKSTHATRWETWEATGGMSKFLKNTLLFDKPHISPPPPPPPLEAEDQPGVNVSGNPHNESQGTASGLLTPATSSGHHLPPRPVTPDRLRVLAAHNSTAASVSHDKSTDARAARKAEIERRCLKLDPSLNINVLKHMHAFNAAIQLASPFTDRDWRSLKPRLLAQREAAETKEIERLKHKETLRVKAEERREREVQVKEAQEQADSEWDAAQKPLKDRLVAYVNTFIREGWKNGDAVSKKNCARFAAHALLHVRHKFYSDLADEDARLIHEGKPIKQDLPDAPPARKIILENMKYIFDTKIKPLTERFQKELFLCNGCDNNMKFFGFEGVIQHYAAKHTSELSLGSIIVHWRAEWPEKPPFHPDPDSAKALFKTMQQHNAMRYHAHPAPYPRQSFGASTTHAYPASAPPPLITAASPVSPHDYSQATTYGSSAPGGTPLMSPPTIYSPLHTQAATSAGSWSPHHHPSFAQPPARSKGNGVLPRASGHHQQKYTAPVVAAACVPVAGTINPRHAKLAGPGASTASLRKNQLDDMARNARSVWNCTSGVKDMPANVRAHVLLHHVMENIEYQYATELSLELFSEGVNSHPQMKPIRNLAGLVCKACNPIDSDGCHQVSSYYMRGKPRLFTLPGLLAHFQKQHVERATGNSPSTPVMDWRYDMLLLADHATIAALAEAPGMDEEKMRLVAAAFPQVFPPAGILPQEQYFYLHPPPPPSVHSRHSNNIPPSPVTSHAQLRDTDRRTRSGGYRLVEKAPASASSPRYLSPIIGKRRADSSSKGYEYVTEEPDPANDTTREKCTRTDHRQPKPKRPRSSLMEYPVKRVSVGAHPIVKEEEQVPSSLRSVAKDGEVVEQSNTKGKGSVPQTDRVSDSAVRENEPPSAAEQSLNRLVPRDEAEYTQEIAAVESSVVLPTSDAGSPENAERPAQHSAYDNIDDCRPDLLKLKHDVRHDWRGERSPSIAEVTEHDDPQVRHAHYSDEVRGKKGYGVERQYSEDSHMQRIFTRSRSPGTHETVVVEPYYRDSSHSQHFVRRHRAYAVPTGDSYYDAVPVEELSYAHAPRGSRYQYIQDMAYAEPVYTEEVSGSVRYDEYGAAAPTYIVERPRQRRGYVELDYGQQASASAAHTVPVPPPPPPPPAAAGGGSVPMKGLQYNSHSARRSIKSASRHARY